MKVPALVIRQSVPVDVLPDDEKLLRESLQQLDRDLRPNFSFVGEYRGRLLPQHLVGNVTLPDGRAATIVPDVPEGTDWQRAVVDLITSDRIAVSGHRRAAMRRYADLASGLAGAYAERLLRAFSTEGSPTVYVDRSGTLSTLRGRLIVSHYSLTVPWARHRFPLSFQELSVDNPFTQAMSFVASHLARGAPDARIGGDLSSLAYALRAGLAPPLAVNAAVASRRLPPQWRAFEPAWDIARAMLSRGALLRGGGERHGLEVVVQTWPLLEELLDRTLQAVMEISHDSGLALTTSKKTTRSFLKDLGGQLHRAVEPDGELQRPDGAPMVTLEAKHSRGPTAGDDAWPTRDHRYQAVATAKARGADVAVLVYPGDFPTVRWEVAGLGPPYYLLAVGLKMYSYVRGEGERERAQLILAGIHSLLEHSQASYDRDRAGSEV